MSAGVKISIIFSWQIELYPMWWGWKMQKQCYRNTCRMRCKWINLYAHIRTWGTIYIRSEKLLFYRPRFKICRMPKDNFRHAWWCKYKQHLQVLESEKYRFCIMTTFQKGSFNNYVDRILPFWSLRNFHTFSKKLWNRRLH